MRLTPCLAALSIAATLLLPLSAWAGDGHDHGDAAPAANGPALPRFAAVSETFELVGVLSGKQITLYLDRSADNAPVTDASIELEVAGAKFKAQKHEDVYEVVLAAEPQPGVLPIIATVTAGQAVDLLAGELDLHGPSPGREAAHAQAWKAYAAWAAAAIGAIAAAALIGRRLAVSRQRRAGAGA